mgnify:CR=1 FL=1
MRILHVSDFHAREEWFHWLLGQTRSGQFDCCVFTGDFLDIRPTASRSVLEQIQFLQAWLAYHQGCPLFVCTGNHDYWGALDRPAGLPPEFDEAGWIFGMGLSSLVQVDFDPIDFGPFQIQARKWQETAGFVPSSQTKPVLLLNHAPPEGARTAVDRDGMLGGDFELGAMADYLPKGSLILSGHVHHAEDWHDVLGKTVCLNPGMNEKRDALFPNHIVIDTERRRAEFRSVNGPLGPVRI